MSARNSRPMKMEFTARELDVLRLALDALDRNDTFSFHPDSEQDRLAADRIRRKIATAHAERAERSRLRMSYQAAKQEEMA